MLQSKRSQNVGKKRSTNKPPAKAPSTKGVEIIGQPLWDGWSETPPEHTKAANNGRYDFTAIEPTYQLQEATRRWGPYGEAWGIRNMKWTIDPANTFIMLEAVFYYPGETSENSFEYAVDEKWRPGFNVCKVLITTFRSKCLSSLGMCADIFMGLFDDATYVADLKAKYGDMEKFRITFLAGIAKVDDEDRLADATTKVDTMLAKKTIEPQLASELYDAIASRRASF